MTNKLQAAQAVCELGCYGKLLAQLERETQSSNESAYQRGYMDGRAKPIEAALKPGEPDRYVWEEYNLWSDGWGWHERENDTDPRTPENKQYYPNTDFNDPEQVRNFRALYTAAPPAQTPPRLAPEEMAHAFNAQCGYFMAPTGDDLQAARAIETAVRKQFGVNE